MSGRGSFLWSHATDIWGVSRRRGVLDREGRQIEPYTTTAAPVTALGSNDSSPSCKELPPLYAVLRRRARQTLRVSDEGTVAPETPDHDVDPVLTTERLLDHPGAAHQILRARDPLRCTPDREVVQEAFDSLRPAAGSPARVHLQVRAQSGALTRASGEVRECSSRRSRT